LFTTKQQLLLGILLANLDAAMSVTWDPNAYAKYRPRYPSNLYDAILQAGSQEMGRELAVDVGCGSGQATIDLAKYFTKVIGIDASESQLRSTLSASNVEYKLGTSEATGMPNNCADVVVAATSLHWFDKEAFYVEARRILRSSGVLAAWSYNRLPRVSEDKPAANELFHKIVLETFLPYFDKRLASVLLAASYDALIPSSQHFRSVEKKDIEVLKEMSLEGVMGWLRSTSAVTAMMAVKGVHATEKELDTMHGELKAALKVKDDQEIFPVIWNFDLFLAKDPMPLSV